MPRIITTLNLELDATDVRFLQDILDELFELTEKIENQFPQED